ncbi:MAG: hypothetical protein AB8F65_14220 [Woeseiaceae bacterium]
MSLFNELKRRNVVRVATAYVIVGWLLLQVSDVVLDFTEAPMWIGKLLIAVLVIGFFVALVLSWVFEATPEGIRRDDGSSNPDLQRAHRLNVLTIAAAVAVIGLFTWQQFNPRPAQLANASQPSAQSTPEPATSTTPKPGEPPAPMYDASIAVLPFADLSPAGDQEYFSDGIAEEILNVLVRIDALSVASRTSAFAFKGRQDLGIPEIGKALNVRYVLEGSVRSAGDSIRVTAQLIDSTTDKHLWSQTFDDKLSAEMVFEIQDKIATAIVDELSALLNINIMGDDELVVRADTSNLDAYQLFLQGRERFRKRSSENLPGTIRLFEQATELDPTFARAWSGLAATSAVAPSWSVIDGDKDLYELAKRAARKAIELDDSLSQPYAVLGTVTRDIENDFAAAFELYDEALTRDPNDADALLWRSIDSIIVGFFDRAIVDLQRCQAVDPGYENCFVFEGLAHLYKRDYDSAFALFDYVTGVNSGSQTVPYAIAMVRELDQRTATLALAWVVAGYEIPIKPEQLFRLLAEDDIDRETEFQVYAAEQEALTGERPEALTGYMALFFGQYERIQASVYAMLWWHPSLPHFSASPDRNRLIRDLKIDQYWRKSGFPPQCKPLGDDDFVCD